MPGPRKRIRRSFNRASRGPSLMCLPAFWSSSARQVFFSATRFGLGVLIMSLIVGCGGGGGTDSSGNPIAPAPSGGGGTSGGGPSSGGGGSTSASASVSLAWNPVPDSSVYAYFVHYGKQSSGQAGSCNYTASTFVGSPSATITGLDPNTQYFFAVSAYNGLQSTCSNEVSTVTPSAA